MILLIIINLILINLLLLLFLLPPLHHIIIKFLLPSSQAGAECLDHTYEAFLNQITDVHWSGTGFDWRPWLYQTCTEFGWYQVETA